MSHVLIVVAVVAHEHERVLPDTGIGIGSIADDLVYHYLGLSCGGDGESTYGNILQLTGGIKAGPLSQNAQPAVAHIAGHCTEGVLALIGQQIVVGIESLASGGKHAVVPHTVSEKQEILGFVCLRGSSVGEHAQIAAIGIGIGGATGKFVV